MAEIMADAVDRFSGFADLYDRVRPSPPTDLLDLVCQWAGTDAPLVVDLAAGTGLSTRVWSGRAARVTAIEPSQDMRAVCRRRVAALPDAGAFTVAAGTAERIELPDASADVVTASQALHWFDPERALPEVARLLRDDGVFAAYDCDWPPAIDWRLHAAYLEFERRSRSLEAASGGAPPRHRKDAHADRMARTALFRQVAEVALHARDRRPADDLVELALSQGTAQSLLASGCSEAALGVDRLRVAAAAFGSRPLTWWWTYRVRLAVR